MQRPTSITLFAVCFLFSLLISSLLAFYAAQSTDFGFKLTPEAAQTLLMRIKLIRLVGIGFALWLMLMILFGRSRTARGALGLRWILGLLTSVAFLRGVGVTVTAGGNDLTATGLSIIQLGVEGFAILILYGENAAVWFDRR